jgi:hypothetical protein
VQGGGDSTTPAGREDQVPADLPGDEAPVRLGRSRAWNRRALSRAGANPNAAGEGVPEEDTALGSAEESTVAAPPASPAGPTMELSPIFRNWSDPAASANTPERCHFLRGISDNGRLVDPQREAIPTHRCAAFGEPLPLSLRQQELVCLQRVHVSCPRYLRGALLASESAAEPETVRTRSGISRTAAAGLGLIVVAALIGGAAASGFVPGLVGESSPRPAYVAGTNPPSAPATSTPVIGVSPTAETGPSLTPTPTATSSPTPSPTLNPTVAPSPTPWPPCPPGATGGRLVCLVPCPDQASCYEYMVHSGDKLNEIAFYFGVTMQSIWAMNPWLHESTKITVGEILRLPPPTK